MSMRMAFPWSLYPTLRPILFPKLRIYSADFPYLLCSMDQRLLTLETSREAERLRSKCLETPLPQRVPRRTASRSHGRPELLSFGGRWHRRGAQSKPGLESLTQQEQSKF